MCPFEVGAKLWKIVTMTTDFSHSHHSESEWGTTGFSPYPTQTAPDTAPPTKCPFCCLEQDSWQKCPRNPSENQSQRTGLLDLGYPPGP